MTHKILPPARGCMPPNFKCACGFGPYSHSDIEEHIRWEIKPFPDYSNQPWYAHVRKLWDTAFKDKYKKKRKKWMNSQ